MPRTIGTRSPSGPTRVYPCGWRGAAVRGETNGTIVDVTSLASRRSGHWYVLQSEPAYPNIPADGVRHALRAWLVPQQLQPAVALGDKPSCDLFVRVPVCEGRRETVPRGVERLVPCVGCRVLAPHPSLSVEGLVQHVERRGRQQHPRLHRPP